MAHDVKKGHLADVAAVPFSNNLLSIQNVNGGARVMLTNNINVTDGGINDQMGTVT